MSTFRFKKLLILLFMLALALVISTLLTSRYFPIDPDGANSSLVWRALLSEGLSAFRDWAPTPDNWYFTTYPVNFVFFLLMNNDGILPLMLSTSLFIGLTAFMLALVIYTVEKSWFALIALLSLILFPAYVYTFGFAAHPFSHYSTNFFGVLTFALCFLNLKRNSTTLAVVCSLIALLASISDPWLLATYFLPLLLVQAYFAWKGSLQKKIPVIFAVSFIVSMSHVVQRLFGLPIQRFHLMPFDQWGVNTEWAIHILGKSLNILFVDSPYAYVISLLVWVVLFVYSFLLCLRKGKEAVFVAGFSLLTIAAIVSSFIISYDSPAEISARFFVNVVCFAIALSALGYAFSKKWPVVIVFALFIASSLYSYQQNKTPIYDQQQQTYDYINFLEKNNLTFGYGDYWKLSNNVNWLSDGRIHISPVLFDTTDNRILFDTVRLQTMKSWLTDDYVSKSPDRQFVAIPAVKSSEADTQAISKLDAIRHQLGEPDEMLTFQDMTFFVYHHKIPLIK